MRNFNRGGKSGRGGFNTRGYGNRDSGRNTMYKATCAECGNDCEVPFRPSSGKPVFCSSCFEGKGGRRENSRRSSFGDKKMFSATCAECGKECEVPFRPTEGKPIYCTECFSKKGGQRNKGADSQPSGQQFDILNKKLDQILAALNPTVAKKDEPKKAAVKAKPASGTKTAKKPTKKPAAKKAKK